MKLISAMILPEKRDAVQAVLGQLESPAVYLSEVLDLRDQVTTTYRGAMRREPLVKLRVDVLVVNDLMVEDVIRVIAEAACDAQPRGKASILVVSVDEWIPLRGVEPRFAHSLAA